MAEHAGPIERPTDGLTDDAIDDLIDTAAGYLRPHQIDDRLCGDVAATLISATGRRFSGVCLDLGSGVGFCAEHSAVAAMVTAGEYAVAAIVAVWRDPNPIAPGPLHVLPPCGRCREFLRQIDPHNLDTAVVLGRGQVAPLRDLLPFHAWPEPLPPRRPTPH